MTVLLHAVTDGRTGMLDELRRDGRRADPPRPCRRVPELGVGRDAAEMDGEERRSEVRGDPAPEPADRRRWSPHVELDRRIPDRIEEPEALDVVGVQMRDEDVDPFRAIASQRHAERADTGAGIE